jgi:glutamate/tyrosine decarboxylase-like PLP-dependent enzyme
MPSKNEPLLGFIAFCNILANKITIHLIIKTNNLGINDKTVSIGARSIFQMLIAFTGAEQSGHQSFSGSSIFISRSSFAIFWGVVHHKAEQVFGSSCTFLKGVKTP